MIAARVDDLSYSFPDSANAVLRHVCWNVEPGSTTLVVGPSGSGKSTLLRCLNGLIPHFHGGRFGGNVVVLGANTRERSPRDFAHSVGVVFQDPESQFITDRVEDEIVFGMENLGFEPRAMRLRLEETLDLLGIHHLRGREVATLSGGERQRVAIAVALATRPELLVLDEPTSQLDPLAAHDVLAAVEHLNRDLGLTIVLSEHRLDRVLPFAGRIVEVARDVFRESDTQTALQAMADVPPLVALGRELGWDPLPVTIRDARRFVDASSSHPLTEPDPPATGDALLTVDGVSHRYGDATAVRDVSFTGRAGEVVALIGRNGSGKTTLLKLSMGLLRPTRGRVLHAGGDIARLPVHDIARDAGYVPQHPTTLLHQESVLEELAFGPRLRGIQTDASGLLARLGIAEHADRHPLDLSGGERQRAALAAIAISEPSILLLDEPTRGLPAADKRALARFVRDYASEGRLVIVATHDVEFVATAADRVLLLAEGELVADDRPASVLGGSLAFATQMNRLLGGRALTLDDALAALRPPIHAASNDVTPTA
ncbi:MAG TPA: ATP-binding cassette domain-containing protein [Thermomicrobiales bacterium]|nr:ATP-binding cassette domain-containing protein [Thermomicrobiales bacterium]